MHDVAPVTDELSREPFTRAGGQELRRLELLNDEERFLLCAATRRVVALEGEEDDEAEHDREARREHAEDARGAVAVLEVASLRSTSPDEQHRADGHRGHAGHDQDRDREVHAAGRNG